MKEVYKGAIGYEGLYLVSNLGNVKSLLNASKPRILKGGLSSNGYLTVNMYRNKVCSNRTIHSVVAEAFLNYKKEGFETVVDHKDGNKLNNKLSNLEVISNRKNTSKGMVRGKSKYVGVTLLKDGRWRATIFIRGRRESLGVYTKETDARDAYLHRLNNILEEPEPIRDYKMKRVKIGL